MDYDATNIPDNYDRGRDHGPAVLRQWMDVVAIHVDRENMHYILDLGCGTGRFSQSLAARFDANVVGIDPSRKMLNHARGNRKDGRVFYAGGCAEALPLRTGSISMVFISMVFHHFKDPWLAAGECKRVLGKRGRVCLRTGSLERVPRYPYLPFFPSSRPLLDQRLPSLAAQQEAFEAASLQTVFSGIVTQQVAPNYAAYAEKLACGADSILMSLDRGDFDAGMEALHAYAAGEGADQAVTEPIDFLVFDSAAG